MNSLSSRHLFASVFLYFRQHLVQRNHPPVSLEPFPIKWTLVERKNRRSAQAKMRQNNNLERRSESIRSENALSMRGRFGFAVSEISSKHIPPSRLSPLRPRDTAFIDFSMLVRALGMILLASLIILPAFAETARIRPQIVIASDTVTLADLIADWPSHLENRPVFRAPLLGETGTIQTGRIVEAANRAGLAGLTSSLHAVDVTRPAKTVSQGTLEQALKAALVARHGTALTQGSLIFEEGMPIFRLAQNAPEEIQIETLTFDTRSRKLSATLRVDGSSTQRVQATLVEMVEVSVLSRALARGEALMPADILREKRPRDSLSSDFVSEIIFENRAEEGKGDSYITRRALPAGTLLRMSDLTRPEAVAKGDNITLVYETPGLTLTLRGKALEGGPKGENITVQNPQSKKILHGIILGPGQVRILSAPHRVALVGSGR
jgi:flagellar basal body P-ring formation protein FlgA